MPPVWGLLTQPQLGWLWRGGVSNVCRDTAAAVGLVFLHCKG